MLNQSDASLRLPLKLVHQQARCHTMDITFTGLGKVTLLPVLDMDKTLISPAIQWQRRPSHPVRNDQSVHALVKIRRKQTEKGTSDCFGLIFERKAFTCPEVKDSGLPTFGFFIAHDLGDVAFVLGDYLTTYHVVSRR